MLKLKVTGSTSQNIGCKPNCIIGEILVTQVIAGTITLSPSFKLYFSFIAATNNKLAVLPDETNKECLHPNHLLHSCSNFLTIGPLVKRPAFCINSIIAVLSSAVMQSFINGQNVLCSCVDMSFIF